MNRNFSTPSRNLPVPRPRYADQYPRMEINPRSSQTTDHDAYGVENRFPLSSSYTPTTFANMDEGWPKGEIPTRRTNMREELLSTIQNSNVDTWSAARILEDFNAMGSYSEDEYRLFIRDPKVAAVKYYDMAAPLFPQEIEDLPRFLRLFVLKSKVMSDIQNSHMENSSVAIKRCHAKISHQLDLRKCKDLPFSEYNLKPDLLIPGDGTFKSIKVREVLTKYWKTTKRAPDEQLFAALKFIICQIAIIPDDILIFSHSTGQAPVRKHSELPQPIILALYDLIMQLPGFHHEMYEVAYNEAKNSFPEEWHKLGNDQEERMKKFNRMSELRDSLLESRSKFVAAALNELRRCSFVEEADKTGAMVIRRAVRNRLDSGEQQTSS